MPIFFDIDYVLTQVIWTVYFLKYQVYEIHVNIIYQENKSAIKLDNNFRQSSSNQACFIIIRYYFVTDRITK